MLVRPVKKRLFCLEAKYSLGRLAPSALPHYYDLWYNKGLHKSGEISIEPGLCDKCIKNVYVDCARLEVEPIICRHKPARWDFLVRSSIFIWTHNFAVASLMPVLVIGGNEARPQYLQ